MKYKKILSTVLAVHMLSNFVIQAMPAGAIGIPDDTDTKKLALSEEVPFNAATGNPVFVAENENVKLGENTISNSCGDNAIWTYDADSHTLVINGSGSVLTLTYKSDEILDYLSEIETIIVEGEITSLNEDIFEGCTNVSKLVLPFAGFNANSENQECTLSSFFGETPEKLAAIQITGGTVVPDSFCYDINSLTEVILNDSIYIIGNYAFYGTSLTSLTLPSGLTSIGNYAFYYCRCLTDIIFSGNNLKSIGESSFCCCSALTDIVLPDGIETIGKEAFNSCSSLESVYIPATATSIGENMLFGCNGIKHLSMPAISITSDNSNYTLKSIFYTSYYSYDEKVKLETLEINSGTIIPKNFAYGFSVNSLKIADTVTEIGNSAFGYSSVANLELPSSVTTIGDSAFCGCSDLTEIKIPGNVKTIGNSAFEYCSSATSVIIDEGTETIMDSVFHDCSSLESINLPSTLKEIGDNAFTGTAIKELIIPSGVISIGSNILYNCNSLQKLTIPYAGLDSNDNSALCELFADNSYIPETLTSLEITGGTDIPDSYCYGVSSLTDVKLADTITSIGSSAFYDCTNLLNITMPDELNYVGESAFYNTAWYGAKDNGVVYAGKVAVSYKGTIPKNFALKFKDDTIGIADSAFYNENNINSVKFPETIQYIGNSAFYSCNGITSIKIPESVVELGSSAFASCSNLSEVTLSENISHIGSNPFDNTLWDGGNEDGAVYIGKVFVGYKGKMPKKTKLVLKDGTTEIADNALQGYENLNEIVIPDTVTSIGDYAFYECTNLVSLKIPDSVVSIGASAFSCCSSLKSINIPDGIKEIKPNTFNGCEVLTSVVIPDSVTEIRDNAFYNNKALKKITASGSVVIKDEVFNYDFDKDDEPVERTLIISENSKTIKSNIASSLKDTLIAVTLPKTLTSIGDNAFNDCDLITTINIPETVVSIGTDAFYDCDGLTEIIVPPSVKTIGTSAFTDCSKIAVITLNDGLENIGEGAFANCEAVVSITIPDTVTQIGSSAFSSCTSLTEVKLPDSIKKISSGLFSYCNSLTSVNIPYGVETIEDYAFTDCPVLTKIVIPDTIKEVYSDAYYNYGSNDDEDHQTKMTLVIADGSKTVTKEMTNGLENIANEIILPDSLETIDEEAFAYFTYLSEIEIPKNVTAINFGAFYQCSDLSKVILPEGLKILGNSAFEDCYSLKTIKIPDSITEIRSNLFNDCTALESVKLSENVTIIGEYAFGGCSLIKSIVIPESVVTIGESAFSRCSSIKSVVIPENVQEIKSHVFACCDSLDTIKVSSSVTIIDDNVFGYEEEKNITIIFADGIDEITNFMVLPFRNYAVKFVIPDSVTEISESAFAGCSKLEEINLPDSVTNIGEYAFSGCTSLHTLVIPESVTRISKGLCYDCTSLETVTLLSKINRITDNAFYNCINLKKIISDVKDFYFRSTSFRYCDSLFDSRFMLLDKRAINFSSNTDKSAIDGIVNFSLSYKLMPFLFEDGAIPVLNIDIPAGMTLLNADSFNENYSEYTKELTELSGTVNFSVRVEEFGEYHVSASLDFSYDDENWNETIGSVDIKSPVVSISVPTSVNTTSIKVKGFARCGEDVTIYVDGAETATVTANEKTGKYYQTIEVPEKESGESYEIYASVADETTNTISVLYEPEKPMVEAVYVSYNGNNQHMDITSAFTEGKRPVISINPSYPFEFEIEMSNSDNVSRLFVISQKGGEIKSIEAYWNKEKQVWIAFGYFDPNNKSYVPGTLNISVYERKPVVIDVSNGIINASDEIMESIYENSGMDSSEWSNKIEDIPEIKLPEEVDRNTTSEVVYESDDAVISDFHVSDGQQSEDLSVYMDTSDTIVVDGKQVSAEQVAKNPESYGFMRSDLSTVDNNGNQYDFYTRVPGSADAALHIYDNFEKNNNKNPGTDKDITFRDMARWTGATGTQTIRVPKDTSDSKGESVFLNTLVTTARDDIIEELVNTINDVSGNSEELTAKLKTIAQRKMSSDYELLNKSFKVYNTVKNGYDIINSTWDAYDRLNKLSNVKNSDSLKRATVALAATKIGYTLVGSKVVGEAGGAIIGAAIGTFFCPGAGMAIGKICGTILAHTLAESLFNWFDKKLDEQIAFAEGGYISVLIDPSGYIYEAVKQNRISGAKMTIYYKDPDTGKEIEWVADDFDQKNPLTTDENGEYAWDVPEGLWRVKFEKDGYETAYSEWMNVPPVQTGVNLSVKSLEKPEILNAVVADGAIIVTFSKYMNISTINKKSISVTADKKNVSFTVTPILSDEKNTYTDTFTIKPSDEKNPSGNLSITFADTCKSYSGVSLAKQTAKVEVPVNIISLTVDNNKVITAQNSDTDITITAKPASIAAGKKIVLSETSGNVTVSEAVFDENGKAVISVNSALTGISELTFGVKGSDLAVAVTIITITPEEYEMLNVVSNDSEDSSEIIPGDVNGDNKVNFKDVVMIRRHIAGGWDIDINERSADVNGDNKVNFKDVVLIRRYIAGGWDVELKSA